MKKLTVQFNKYFEKRISINVWRTAKEYDFLADDNTNVEIGQLVVVQSTISKKGYAVAEVIKIEENTDNLNHTKIISVVKSHGKLADELSKDIDKKFNYGALYLTDDDLYFHRHNSKYYESLSKQLSFILDKDLNDVNIIREAYIRNEFYTLRKQDTKSENCFEIDLITHKVYIAIEKHTLENKFEIDFDNLKFSENHNYIEKLKSIDFSEKIDLTEEKEEFDTLLNVIKGELNIEFFYKNNKGLREMLDDYVFMSTVEKLDFFEIVDKKDLFNEEIKNFIYENIDIYDTSYFHKDFDVILKSNINTVPESFSNVQNLISAKLEKIANVKLHVFRSIEDGIECNEYDEYNVIEYVDSFVEIQ